MTELDAQPGEWIDTNRHSQKLTKVDVQTLSRLQTGKLDGPGWPEVQVPLREDIIPRRWKHTTLRTVGETPLGYRTVIPERVGIVEPTGIVEEEVPF
jgi:hypothetical protein